MGSLHLPLRRSAGRPKRGTSAPPRRCRARGWPWERRDGFADFFGYSPDLADTAPAEARPRDGFADFYGYPEDDAAIPAGLHTVFLPDRDPPSPRSCGAGEGPARLDRQWAEATEASLGLVRERIESRRRRLRLAGGEAAEGLRREVHHLKLQQARLAEALWRCGEGAQAAGP